MRIINGVKKKVFLKAPPFRSAKTNKKHKNIVFLQIPGDSTEGNKPPAFRLTCKSDKHVQQSKFETDEIHNQMTSD